MQLMIRTQIKVKLAVDQMKSVFDPKEQKSMYCLLV